MNVPVMVFRRPQRWGAGPDARDLKKKSSVLRLHWWRLVCRPRGRPGNSALAVPLYIRNCPEKLLSAVCLPFRVMTPILAGSETPWASARDVNAVSGP